jgi:uncharacterized protein DUF6812
MAAQYDEKGKFFTEVISKVAIPAIVQTVVQKIEGSIHVRENERLSDELIRDDPFLPMTSVRVFDQAGRIQYESDFISIRRSQIIWIMPRADRPQGGA